MINHSKCSARARTYSAQYRRRFAIADVVPLRDTSSGRPTIHRLCRCRLRRCDTHSGPKDVAAICKPNHAEAVAASFFFFV